MRTLLLLLLFLRAITAQAQSLIGDSLLRAATSNYELSLKEEDEARSDALARIALDQYRILFAQEKHLRTLSLQQRATACTNAGELAQYFGSNGEALRWYRSVIALAHLPDSLRFRPYIFCGIISYGRSRLDSARWYFEQAEGIQSHSKKPLPEAQRLYNNMGALLFEAGNYRQARNYFEQALALLPQTHPSYRDLYVNYQSNLAAIQIRLGDYDAALARYRALLPYKLQLPEIRNNIGIIYLRKGEGREALHWLADVKLPDARTAGLFNDRAEAWMLLHDSSMAITCIKQALSIASAYYGNTPHAERGRSLRLRGDLRRRQGAVAAALEDYQEALHQYYPTFTYRTITDNPKAYNDLFAFLPLYELLLAKAELLAGYGATAPFNGPEAALATYSVAFGLADYVGRSYDSDEARLFLQKVKYRAHGHPIDLALGQYKATGDMRFLEQAFLFDQQNKASVQALSEQEARTARSGNAKWRRLQDLRASVSRLALQEVQAKGGQRDSIRALKRSLEIESGQLLQQTRREQSHSADSLPGIQHLQGLLSKGTRLLSYHFSDGKMTVFILAKDRFSGTQVSLYNGFDADLRGFATALRGGPAAPAAAKRLSNFLLAPFLGAEHRLLVLPDDELLYLPLEALPIEDGYVAQRYTVQYGANTSLLDKARVTMPYAPVLAFAPFISNGYHNGLYQFAQLPASASEVSGLDGKVYRDGAARKERFLNEAARYPVLHLATHAVANDSLPALSYIAFAAAGSADSSLLYAGEVYDLSLPENRLLILSACETGNGAWEKGEGLLSLGRAFAYAGCANRLTSLWKADDAATADIIQRMYRFLADGHDPGEALQLAKAAYLADPRVHPRRKEPAFWAHLVYTGELPAEKPRHWLWWFAGDLLLVTLAVLLLRRRRKRISLRRAS